MAMTADGVGDVSSNIEKPIVGRSNQLGTGAGRDEVQTDEREVVTFYDASDDVQQTGVVVSNPTMTVGDIYSDIYAFLKRPVKIHYFQWTTAGLNISIDPWALLLSDVAVSRKLANFHLLRTGGIRIKIISNGSPYQYGKYFIGYWPNIVNDPLATNTALSAPARISTLPCFCTIDPSSNSVVEFNIPEFEQRDRTITAAYTLGNIVGTQAALLNTISTVTPYCDITFYAEMITPSIMLNTTQVPIYATSKEFKGAISAPLHRLSAVAHKLSTVPIIGEYATAVSMASKMGASVASLFGYSKPSNAIDTHYVTHIPVSNMINAEGLDNSTTLALTKTAAVSLDPTTLGLPPQDEMAISSIVKKPSLCYILTWNDTSVATDAVGTIEHSPSTCVTTSYPIPLTNLAYVSGLFAYWRGTIRYRLVFCVSKFHSGRVQIVYEPNTLNTSLDPTNVSLNWVVDIAQQQEIEIEVPFSAVEPFRWNDQTNLLGAIKGKIGNLYVKVLNPLRCGSAVTSVNILVFNAAGEDFELAVPTSQSLRNTSYYISWFPSAATGAAPPATAYSNWGTSMEMADPGMSINLMSEQVASLRQLAKRYMFEKQLDVTSTAGQVTYTGIRDVPNQTGTVAAVGGVVRQYLNPFTFFTYFAPAYGGYRGGFRKKIIQMSATGTPNALVTRGSNTVKNTNFGSMSPTSYNGYGVLGSGIEGHHNVARPYASSPVVIEYTNPYQSNNRYQKPFHAVTDYDGSFGVLLVTQSLATTTDTYAVYTAMADDFAFYYYIGAPLANRIAVA